MKLDWLLYGVALAVGTMVTVNWRDRSMAPPAPPPPSASEISLLASFSPFAQGSIISLPSGQGVATQIDYTGTAFSVSQSGEWIIARDSIRNCAYPFLNIGGNLGVPFKIRKSAGHENYEIAVTSGGTRPLPLADPAALKVGQRAFMPGFPRGAVGEATGRFIGRTTLSKSKRFEANESVLAWAESGHTFGLEGSLNQLIGGPAVNTASQVVGITLRHNPRRGRIYTSTPETLHALANPASRRPDYDREEVITRRNYGTVSDTFRREYRVAQVGCLRT